MIETVQSALKSIGIELAPVARALGLSALVLIAAWIIAGAIRRRVQRMLSVRSFGRNGSMLLGRLASIAVFVVAFSVVMGILGVSSTGLLTFLGAFTVALGLSLQDVFKNFFSGIFLLMERPFRVGDVIKVQEIEGEVQGIDVRTTQVRIADGSIVMIPNSVIFTASVTNRSRIGWRRLDLTVVARGMGVAEAERVIHQTLGAIDQVSKPITAPIVTAASRDGATLALSILVGRDAGIQQQVIEALVGSRPEGAITVTQP